MEAVAEQKEKAPEVKYDPVNGSTINEKLSKQMRVTPLYKGQAVIYRLLEADVDDLTRTDLNNKPLKHSQGYRMAGQKTIFDPIAGRKVTIENGAAKEVKVKTPFGEFKTKRPSPVEFTSEKPAIHVTYDQPDLYAFMERVDENIDNPFRNNKVKPRFYRVDQRKKVFKQLEQNDYKLDALMWVSKQATYQDLIICAEKLKTIRPDKNIKTDYTNEEASTGYELLKRELFALAEVDPQSVIKASTKVDAQMKMQIRDAESFMIIMFADGSKIKTIKDKIQLREWFHNDKDLTSITIIEPGKDKYEGLMDFFAKDKNGPKHYEKMVGSLERVFSSQKTGQD